MINNASTTQKLSKYPMWARCLSYIATLLVLIGCIGYIINFFKWPYYLFIYLVFSITDMIPCILLAIYLTVFPKKEKRSLVVPATLLIASALSLVSFFLTGESLSILRLLQFGFHGLYFILSLLSLILALTDRSKTLFGTVASVVGIFLEVIALASILRRMFMYHIYDVDYPVSLILFNLSGHIGTMLMLSTVFSLSIKKPGIDEPVYTYTESGQTDIEAALNNLIHKRRLGQLTEQEYQVQRTEILRKI